MAEEEVLLVVKAKNGDLESFGKLLSLVEAKLFRVALILCGERETARDLLQETFLAIYQILSRFSGKSSFYTYSYRILLHPYHKMRRKHHKVLIPLLENLRTPTPSPAESFREEEKKEKVCQAIARLPLRFQEVIILRYLGELTYQEIAKNLKIREGTVKSRLFKAKKLLAKILKQSRASSTTTNTICFM